MSTPRTLGVPSWDLGHFPFIELIAVRYGEMKNLLTQDERRATETALPALEAMRKLASADERVIALLANELRWMVEHSAWASTEHGSEAGDRLSDVVALLETAADEAVRSAS